ncbi:gliding motility lipoprotein GldD [Aquirufa sp. HETE-83D]|uniref:Gliding motility lipoprotein GldD n=1 Tax=Aquirufa esocilacus TaxID=3096513 RepID=A0ABW6DH70_9BACT
MRLFLLGCILTLFSCGTASVEDKSSLPRPKGFPLIAIPSHQYMALENGHPFSFDVSKQANVKKDTFALAEPHWMYIYYPRWDAFIQLTYKSVGGDRKKLDKMIRDSYILASKHQMKANRIEDAILTTRDGRKATVIELEGEVATPFQFFVTDSTTHFLRGAVYLNTAMKNDSLAPVIRYLKEDAIHLIQTLRWK